MSRDADIQFRAEFTFDDVFRDLDRVDARVDESKRKAASLSSSDPRRAGVSGQAELAAQRAALTQQTSAQRAAHQQQLVISRAAAAQQVAAARARYQQETIVQRAALTQQTATLRSGLTQQTVMLRQEGSQRLAILRSQLRQQEIALKASVGGYKSAAQGITGYFSQGFGQAIAMIAGGNVVATGLIGTFHLLTGAIGTAARALETFITTGLNFAMTLETAERAITALIAVNYEFRSSTGGVATGLEAFNLSAEQAKGVLDQLRVAALKSPLTFEELALGLQQTAAGARDAGISIDELVPITVGISSAVKTLGLDARQVQQEIRGLLAGKQGQSEALAKLLGISSEMAKKWKEQGIYVEELTKKLEPFTIALQQSQNHADVIASTLQDIGLNFARLSVESLFEGLKRAGMVLRDGLIDPVSGEFRSSLKAASDVIDEILNRFGKMAGVIAEQIVRGIETVSSWLVQNRTELGQIADMTIQLVYTVGRALGEIFQTVGTILGISSRTSAEYGTQNSFLQSVKQALFAVETIARVIEGVFHAINAVTNSWIGSIVTALIPLAQVASLIKQANALMGGSSENTATGSRMGTASAGLGDQRGMVTGRRPGDVPKPPGGGRGGGASRPDNQGPQLLAQLREENALLAATEGYDRSMLRLQQEQSKELARIVSLQKEKKISASDAATANKLIAEQMALQTRELNEQRNSSYAAVQEDLIARRLELGEDEIGLIRFKDQLENAALKKRLERELGANEQQRINSLAWRDLKLREEVLQKRLDDTRLAAQKEMLELLDRERERRLQMFAEWQEQAQQQAEQQPNVLRNDFDARGVILEQLQGIRGLEEIDYAGITEQLAAMGLTVETLGDKFGHVATNVRDMQTQLEAVEEHGPLVQKFIGALQEAAEQAKEVAISLSAQFIPNVFSAIGEALGGALAGVEDFGAALKKATFQLIGELASAWGRYFILQGAGMLFTNPAGGLALIAAGIALTALGSFLSAKSQASTAASASPSESSSNVSNLNEEREKRIRRRSFNTSGESEERRPLGLFGGAGAGDNKLEVDVTFNSTGNAVMDKMITDHGIVTVRGLGRGSVRKTVRKRIA